MKPPFYKTFLFNDNINFDQAFLCSSTISTLSYISNSMYGHQMLLQ